MITFSGGSAGHLKRGEPAVGRNSYYLWGALLGRCWWFWFPTFNGTWFSHAKDEVREASVSWLCWWFTVTSWPWTKAEQKRRAAEQNAQCASAQPEP